MRLPNKILSVGISILLIGMIAACNRGPDDATLAANVKAKLAADTTLSSAGINVTAQSGAVTLSGTVNSEADKSKAEQIAKGVDGVKSVTNSLTVKPPVVNATPPPVSPDAKLKTDVMAALTKYGITGVNVEVANGEVTLTGDIPRAKLQDAMKAAQESHPKKVNNKMNIK
ncbi:MAG TPA: BON domain-containing protein [Pyrinomonadaceae bacterium]|nr:BON domain-containing protein [Pyrinomonadaceae bacterium]